MAGRLTKVGKAFYLFTMPGHLFPDSSVLTNSAWSYLRRADFLMKCQRHCGNPPAFGLRLGTELLAFFPSHTIVCS